MAHEARRASFTLRRRSSLRIAVQNVAKKAALHAPLVEDYMPTTAASRTKSLRVVPIVRVLLLDGSHKMLHCGPGDTVEALERALREKLVAWAGPNSTQLYRRFRIFEHCGGQAPPIGRMAHGERDEAVVEGHMGGTWLRLHSGTAPVLRARQWSVAAAEGDEVERRFIFALPMPGVDVQPAPYPRPDRDEPSPLKERPSAQEAAPEEPVHTAAAPTTGGAQGSKPPLRRRWSTLFRQGASRGAAPGPAERRFSIGMLGVRATHAPASEAAAVSHTNPLRADSATERRAVASQGALALGQGLARPRTDEQQAAPPRHSDRRQSAYTVTRSASERWRSAAAMVPEEQADAGRSSRRISDTLRRRGGGGASEGAAEGEPVAARADAPTARADALSDAKSVGEAAADGLVEDTAPVDAEAAAAAAASDTAAAPAEAAEDESTAATKRGAATETTAATGTEAAPAPEPAPQQSEQDEAAAEPAEPSEPRVWRRLLEPASGREYYVDVETRQSQWQRPAQGWVAVSDPKSGRSYFCCLETRKTVWEDPRVTHRAALRQKLRRAAGRATAGAGASQWRRATDPKTGREYFVNLTTRETRWTPPGADPQAAPPAADPSPAAVKSEAASAAPASVRYSVAAAAAKAAAARASAETATETAAEERPVLRERAESMGPRDSSAAALRWQRAARRRSVALRAQNLAMSSPIYSVVGASVWTPGADTNGAAKPAASAGGDDGSSTSSDWEDEGEAE